MLISVLILFVSRNKDVPWKNALAYLLALPFMGIFSLAIAFVPMRYVYEFSETGIPDSSMTYIVLLAAIIFIGCLYIAYAKPSQWFIKYRRHAWVIIILVVSEIILINVLKHIWGRPRMRSIESIDQFLYWYQITGPAAGEEFRSFPSGHTGNGFVAIVFTLFIAPHRKKLLRWATAFAIIWGVFVAISRILLGAHFISDVIVGGYITLLLFYLFKGLLIKT